MEAHESNELIENAGEDKTKNRTALTIAYNCCATYLMCNSCSHIICAN